MLLHDRVVTMDEAAFEAACEADAAYAESLSRGYGPSDEMDAPSDWDAGTVTFDPYI